MKGPLITMTAITGKPKKDDIYEYLKGLKENGIEQAMLYPRSGCEIEYLSEAWFDTIGNFIKSAKALDMCLWLYDDFNWPSGDACGRVTAVPEFRLKAISTKGENIGQISYKSQHNSGLFGEKYFPNLLSPDAVDYFIKCTHEEYYKRFGEHFGTIIKGMFTDEPSIGYCCHDDLIPYYDGIEDDYRDFCGRDFSEDMVCAHKDFYLNAITVISSRFKSCYIDKISSWCAEHGILMTGHFMQDNDPLYSAKHSGRILENLSRFSLPGIDEIATCFEDTSLYTLLATIEYASGENGAMAEIFALGPCDMSFAKKRAMLYLMACHKVNNYFLAISHMDLRGNMLVRDFFSNFNTDQPDFAGTRLLSDEAKIASSYAKKDFVADVYIRYPFSASASRITEYLDQSSLFELISKLTDAHIQWKFIDGESNLNAPVIELNDDLEFTLDGGALDLSLIHSKISIKDENGDTPRGIFARCFDDGNIVVLNLLAPKGEYYINGKRVFLDKYGVLLSFDEVRYERAELSVEFDVSYSNPNMIRAMYLNGAEVSYIHCERDTTALLAIRNDTEVLLNGVSPVLGENSDILPRGMRSLYKISDTVSLKAGANTIEAKNDFKYLPSVFVIGDFSASTQCGEACSINLKSRESKYSCGEALYDYGKIELATDIIVPYGAKGLEILGTELYTRVYADDELICEKIAPPYLFDISDKLWGKKIRLRIEQFSSIAPIFADVDYWDKNVKESQWRGTPSPCKRSFGFEKISWCF